MSIFILHEDVEISTSMHSSIDLFVANKAAIMYLSLAQTLTDLDPEQYPEITSIKTKSTILSWVLESSSHYEYLHEYNLAIEKEILKRHGLVSSQSAMLLESLKRVPEQLPDLGILRFPSLYSVVHTDQDVIKQNRELYHKSTIK